MSEIFKCKRKRVFDKTNGYCYYCGCKLDYATFEVDHFIPKADGGTNDIDNLVPSCCDCNSIKGVMDVDSFRRSIEAILHNTTYGRIIKKYFGVTQTYTITFDYERKEAERGDL